MPSGEILRRLFTAHANDDDGSFHDAANDLIDEETAKNHRLLAEDLRALIAHNAKQGKSVRNGAAPSPPQLPRDREHGIPLVTVEHPDVPWTRLVVDASVEDRLRRAIDENRRRDLIAAFGVQPTRRLLFYGPPGCGKSLATRVIAAQLERPLLTVRLDAIVSSYLGQTAANLNQVFDFIAGGSWVLLFDEFDAIAKDRADHDEHGELKRVVSALLQMMDRYTGDSLIVAASNHETLLDNAVWRRFEAIIEFGLPSFETRLKLLNVYLRGIPHDERALGQVAAGTAGASGSDLELLATDATRRAALGLRHSISNQDLVAAYRDWQSRATMLRAPSA